MFRRTPPVGPLPDLARRTATRHARLALLAYALSLLAAGLVHRPEVLAGALALAVALSGGQRLNLLRRSAWAVCAFNLTVSLGYIAVGWWSGGFSWHYLALANTRVLLMVFLGFWLLSRISLLDALRGWSALSLCLTLAVGQIETYRRLLADFRDAFASRHPAPPGWRARLRHGAAQAECLMDKSLAATTEASLAMRSRGAFDD